MTSPSFHGLSESWVAWRLSSPLSWPSLVSSCFFSWSFSVFPFFFSMSPFIVLLVAFPPLVSLLRVSRAFKSWVMPHFSCLAFCFCVALPGFLGFGRRWGRRRTAANLLLHVSDEVAEGLDELFVEPPLLRLSLRRFASTIAHLARNPLRGGLRQFAPAVLVAALDVAVLLRGVGGRTPAAALNSCTRFALVLHLGATSPRPPCRWSWLPSCWRGTRLCKIILCTVALCTPRTKPRCCCDPSSSDSHGRGWVGGNAASSRRRSCSESLLPSLMFPESFSSWPSHEHAPPLGVRLAASSSCRCRCRRLPRAPVVVCAASPRCSAWCPPKWAMAPRQFPPLLSQNHGLW